MPVAYRRMKYPLPGHRQVPRVRKGLPSKPMKRNHTVFWQVCNLIPDHTISVLDREHKIDPRGFFETRYIWALICGSVSYALSLNDICDVPSVRTVEFLRGRGVTAGAPENG